MYTNLTEKIQKMKTVNLSSDLKNFYNSVEGFSQESKKILDIVNQRKLICDSLIESYFRDIIKNLNSLNIKENNPFSDKIKELIKSLSEKENEVETNLIKISEDLKLYEENIDSFIIVVFGKVNSGKSSLGNLIAGKSFKGFNISTPEFFILKEKNIKQSIDCFEERETECTAKIQGFKTGSLIWIDTPGIHSLTSENEKIAKSYIDNADLIVYLTSSDSPLRREDLNELEKLNMKEKPVILCITKADTYEEDEVDGEIVKLIKRKSEKDINDQKTWCREEINKSKINNLMKGADVIPTSCLLAIEGYRKDNLEMLKDSGLNDFLGFTTNVLKSHAVNFKKKNPVKRLENFINLTNEDLKPINDYIKSVKSEIEFYSEKLMKNASGSKINIKNDMNQEIDLLFSSYRKKYELNQIKLDDLSIELTKNVNSILESKISETVQKRISEILDKFNESIEILQFETLKVTAKENIENEKHTYSSPVAKNIGKGGGAAIGAMVGGTFFGPVGSFVGSILGGFIGSKLGEQFTYTEEIKLTVGLNLDEEKQRIKDKVSKIIDNNVDEIYNRINSSFFKTLTRLLTDIEIKNNRFLKKLHNEKIYLERI